MQTVKLNNGTLFEEKATFVHTGGSWRKSNEINVIKSGNIWYSNNDNPQH